MAMTPKEQLEILTAYVAGETIQYQGCYDSKWCADSVCGPDYEFDFQHLRYRKKPKPLELWGNASPDNYFVPHGDKKEAEDHCALGWRVVLMREVPGD